MRNYITLLAVLTFLWSCRDKEPTTTLPPVTDEPQPEPTILTDTMNLEYPKTIAINAYRWAYLTGQNEDSVSYGLKYAADLLPSDTIEGNDMGMPKYDGVQLVRKQEGANVFYEWPGNFTIPDSKIWNTPQYLLTKEANVTDPLPFPVLHSFPDTIHRSTPAWNEIKISGAGNWVGMAANFDNAHHNSQDYMGIAGGYGIFPISITLPANEDSVHISVIANVVVTKYNMVFRVTKRASWSKWVYIAD